MRYKWMAATMFVTLSPLEFGLSLGLFPFTLSGPLFLNHNLILYIKIRLELSLSLSLSQLD